MWCLPINYIKLHLCCHPFTSIKQKWALFIMEFLLCWCCLAQCQFGNSVKQDFHVSLFFDVKFRGRENFGRFENWKTLWCGFQMVFYCNSPPVITVLTLPFFARAAWWSKKSVDTSSDLTPVLPGECRVNTHYLYSTKCLCCFCWLVCLFVHRF